MELGNDKVAAAVGEGRHAHATEGRGAQMNSQTRSQRTPALAKPRIIAAVFVVAVLGLSTARWFEATLQAAG